MIRIEPRFAGNPAALAPPHRRLGSSLPRFVAGGALVGAGLLGTATSAEAAPGQLLALEVVGPSVNGGKVRRCEDVARKHGYTLSPDAPLRVTLQLDVGSNRLIVRSARRGQLLDAPRPGWGMEQLCQDAMQSAERAYADEGQPPVAAPPPTAPPASPPRSSYAAPAPESGYAIPPAPAAAASIALDVTGPDANSGKHERCLRVAHKRGVVVDPAAALRVNLVLAPGRNRLQINSQRRGEVLNQQKPSWGMEQLCEDAMTQAVLALAEEGAPPRTHAAPVPPPAAAPAPVAPVAHAARPAPRGFALGPIPPSAEVRGAAKAAANRAVTAWQGAQFDQARAAFAEAGRLQNDPQFLFDQAVCEQRLGRDPEALAHALAFIERAPTSPYRPYADQLVGELQSPAADE